MTTPKSNKKSKIITLRLSPEALSQWPSDSTPKPSAPIISTHPSPSVQPPESIDKASDSNGTPMPTTSVDGGDNSGLAPPKIDRRRRGGAAVAGRKRAHPSIDPNGSMRERGRPGPKKKPRLPDGTIDHSQDNNTTKKVGPTTAAAHRLGPKANTGNINANLRALDRTGKPCRKWERKALQLKSFTGVAWGTSRWQAPPKETSFPGDVKSDTNGSSDNKPNDSSAVGSERSNSGNGDVTMTNGMESSPAPAIMA
ncbi:hypothetical protein LTR78_006025 [Recurvomyces mirabilis]|uniref:INO80 complex, subunit Ies4 n=1 Tax=Recurvomyces mirabilis TaxID=574656 RepID=A0AAE0WLZ2_9PEZI|nr:hypothetical protein LTR78_006025 [Recurvomyces mirabilis]KAK5155164.1 hypothetical protein LTS14_006119 [Recurvomyces mirabilis]